MPDIRYIETAITLCKDEAKVLGLTFGTHKITPGQHLPKNEARSAPELSLNGATGTYMVVMVDPDAPFPGHGFLGPALHWVQPGLKPEPGADGTTNLVAGAAPFIADYGGPAPPPPSNPHRYVFLLYEQPETFEVAKYAPPPGKKVGIRPRIRYDLLAFEKEAKLGPVVASNYFFSK